MLDYESFNYYCNLFQIVVVIINLVICHVDQRFKNGDLGPCQWGIHRMMMEIYLVHELSIGDWLEENLGFFKFYI